MFYAMNMSQGFTQGGNFQGCKQQEHKESYNSINKLSRERPAAFIGQCKKSQLHVILLIIILIVLIIIIELRKYTDLG